MKTRTAYGDSRILPWFWYLKNGIRPDGTRRHAYINPSLLTVLVMLRNLVRGSARRVYWVGKIDDRRTCRLCRIVYVEGHPSHGIEDAPRPPAWLAGLAAVLADLVRGHRLVWPYVQVWPGSAPMPSWYSAGVSALPARGRCGVLVAAADEYVRRYLARPLRLITVQN